MSTNNIPDKSSLVDKQIIKIVGADGVIKKYQYDAETGSLYAVEAPVVIPPFHGMTHIAEDPIPDATTDIHGLMSADDKAKLDALIKTRIGVLGFQGAGFPDDGGWLDGDIMLAAGSEFISIERIGKVVRFTVDSPLPFNCNIEECAQIYWIQDETDTGSIRPPTCAGKLPGINVYGEVKHYLMPENLVVDATRVKNSLSTKGNYPVLIFKRYDDSIAPGLGEFELVLQRNTDTTSQVGWSMTPGPLGVPECVWFMGLDSSGEQIRFELNPNSEPGLLGALMYKGHTLTRQMAIVTSYTSNVLSTNQYNCKFWNVKDAEVVGDEFVATNVWRYKNAQNTPLDLINPQELIKDATSALLEIGSLVQIWEFQLQELNGERIVRRFFNKEPNLNPATLWSLSGLVRFGSVPTARTEVNPGGDTEITGSETAIDDLRLVERTQWGIKGYHDPLLLEDDLETTNTVTWSGEMIANALEKDGYPKPNVEITIDTSFAADSLVGETIEFSDILVGRQFKIVGNSATNVTILGLGPNELADAIYAAGGNPRHALIYSESSASSPSGIPINNRFVANIDYSRDALVVEQLDPQEDREQPVFLWHRSNHKNVYMKALVGMPNGSKFPPIDVLLRAPIDSYDDVYMKVVSRGEVASGPFAGRPYIKVSGVDWKQMPRAGTLRVLTGLYRDRVWKYSYKLAFSASSTVTLIGNSGDPFLFDEDFVAGTAPTAEPTSTNTTPDKTTVVELLHEEYTAPCARLEFSVNDNSGAETVQFQVKGGILDMGEPYELDVDLPEDNYVRGMKPGAYTISRIFTQDGFITTGIETPASDPAAFRVYTGGPLATEIDDKTELWNELEIMYRDDQLWVWWNGMLVPPDTASSADLPTPVGVNTPYYPVTSDLAVGKVGLRLWPGAVVREVAVYGQLTQFNEYKYGQLVLPESNVGTGTEVT